MLSLLLISLHASRLSHYIKRKEKKKKKMIHVNFPAKNFVFTLQRDFRLLIQEKLSFILQDFPFPATHCPLRKKSVIVVLNFSVLPTKEGK